MSILFPRQRRSSSESGVAEFGHSKAVDWPVKRVAEIPGQAFKMASLLAVQTLFSTPKNFFVDPPSMAYGKSRNAKKPDLGLFILELLAKI